MAVTIMQLESAHSNRFISGRFVVFALFGLGIAAGIAVYIFWTMHFAPYIPLQRALADEFESVRPRVEGGRHQGGPPILRVVLHVKEAPRPDDPKLEADATRVRELAATHLDLSRYSEIELYFVHMPPGGRPSRVEKRYSLQPEQK